MIVFAHHGVLESEKTNGQPFVFDIVLKIDNTVDFSDDINNTVDYSKVFDFVKSFATKNRLNLIETLAHSLCDQILLMSETIKSVQIEIKKPNAPLDGEFEYVSVKISKKRSTAYLSLGSNIGDKYKNLTDSMGKIGTINNIKLLCKSKFYTTSPVGYENQDDFLNCCIKISTLLDPNQLLKSLKNIEKEMFREKTVRFGPRTIDIDILLYNDDIIVSDELIIPHLQMLNRKFVLIPLLDIYNDDILKLFEFKKALKKLENSSDKTDQ
jgi:dihydroneopterin aldolase/2-amino-4-hydroxy-6-hydroxymethyldihydropteridine diphosphokinase